MKTEEFKDLLVSYQKIINDNLAKVANPDGPASLYEPIKYVVNSGGKRIRPVLVMLSCEALGGDRKAAIDAAVAIELLHNFTLVHDDIMDKDDTRRGMPTVHAKWDTDVALLAGDGLVSLAYRWLLKTRSPRIAEIAQIFTDGIIELCEGQALDCDFETRRNVSLGEYLLMIGKKTARLLDISARIGALIGNGSEQQVRVLGEFAYNLGCGFQIQDDLLDITTNDEVLGKAQGSDLVRKKQTYLLVHALTHGNPDSKKRLISALEASNGRARTIEEVQMLFEETGSIAATQEAIRGFISLARVNLNRLPSSRGKDALSFLLTYVENRKA